MRHSITGRDRQSQKVIDYTTYLQKDLPGLSLTYSQRRASFSVVIVVAFEACN